MSLVLKPSFFLYYLKKGENVEYTHFSRDHYTTEPSAGRGQAGNGGRGTTQIVYLNNTVKCSTTSPAFEV